MALSKVCVQIDSNEELPGFDICCDVRTKGQTGVEMEALTGVSLAALTLFDMLKAIDKTMSLQNIRVISKAGGKSGPSYGEGD